MAHSPVPCSWADADEQRLALSVFRSFEVNGVVLLTNHYEPYELPVRL